MRSFRMKRIFRKYFKPYLLVLPADGEYVDGKWVPAPPVSVERSGSIQPLNARLMSSEGGTYTATDRALYTDAVHSTGDRIEYKGILYYVAEATEREYCDLNQYVIRKVEVHDSL